MERKFCIAAEGIEGTIKYYYAGDNFGCCKQWVASKELACIFKHRWSASCFLRKQRRKGKWLSKSIKVINIIKEN